MSRVCSLLFVDELWSPGWPDFAGGVELSVQKLTIFYQSPVTRRKRTSFDSYTMASKISSALPSHMKPASMSNGDAEGAFQKKHHGKSQSHVVSSDGIVFQFSFTRLFVVSRRALQLSGENHGSTWIQSFGLGLDIGASSLGFFYMLRVLCAEYTSTTTHEPRLGYESQTWKMSYSRVRKTGEG